MFRMTGALLLSMAIALFTGPKLIAYLKKLHFGQTIYELGPAHQKKQGTPVMGGLMMAACFPSGKMERRTGFHLSAAGGLPAEHGGRIC